MIIVSSTSCLWRNLLKIAALKYQPRFDTRLSLSFDVRFDLRFDRKFDLRLDLRFKLKFVPWFDLRFDLRLNILRLNLTLSRMDLRFELRFDLWFDLRFDLRLDCWRWVCVVDWMLVLLKEWSILSTIYLYRYCLVWEISSSVLCLLCFVNNLISGEYLQHLHL